MGPIGDEEGGYQSPGHTDTMIYIIDTDGAGTSSSRTNWEEPYGLYMRHSQDVLGDSNDDIDTPPPPEPTARCFNCGLPGHVVSACPEPWDRELIALSRQLFSFYKGENQTNYQRIHVVEEWRKQRLEWLETLRPGEVRGTELMEALGTNEGEWLKNISLWGYPRGWVGAHDPREQVRVRIESEALEEFDPSDEPRLLILGEEEEGSGSDSDESKTLASDHDSDDTSPDHPSPSSYATGSLSPTHRWAEYPPAYFSSQLLPIYNGFSLPPVGSTNFTIERRDSWAQFVSAPPPPPDVPPPPLPPPPPSMHPPPLPPLYPPTPPPIPISATSNPIKVVSESAEDSSDMEFSDED